MSIVLAGRDGGKIGKIADYSVIAPNSETYRIQESALAIILMIITIIVSFLQKSVLKNGEEN